MNDLYQAISSTFAGTMAKIFTPVGKADVVIQCPPAWIRAKTAEAIFGLKRDFLNGLVAKKKVTAKKADKVVIYKFADIVKAIDSMVDFTPNER